MKTVSDAIRSAFQVCRSWWFGDQIDIMASLRLKMEIDVCEILLCQFSPHPLMANFIVLAKHASHGASGKKDGP
jgi:hypothetical protein